MPRVKPFRAVRPPAEKAARVASVPYDVVNRAEAAKLAEGNPESFLHVVRPDIDLPADTDPYADEIYAKAAENFRQFIDTGVLQQDEQESIFLYRQIMNGKSQIGVVACCHVDDYENNKILKHEFTRPAKEDDRTRHVMTLAANAGPVFLTYRDHEQINQSVESAIQSEPLFDFTAEDGVQHTVWNVDSSEIYCKALGEVPAFYVADGHHRAASAWRAGKARREANSNHTGEEEYNWFLTVLFPASQLNVLAYNRVLKDLNGQTAVTVRERLTDVGTLEPTDNPVPDKAGSFCIYMEGSWYKLEIADEAIDHSDPINSLDVALLEKRVIGPIFGIEDVRTDPRIDFVGGIRGTGELEQKVESGEWACAVSMYPTSIEQLMAVSDAGEVMPPKSTWFEPKLRSGLLVHLLD
ncbi:DUF1015 domain-containing protein [Rhodopirellula sp. MGV]|uniref:DUF1015 domain-containing protein n=1 Tax=Rhodopirellula sp. MGV TaxID=2023130 RepID=UPI000B97BBAE|nr:DUF1015 domain-containing protein [Rhodopirellula sp. MGV]OYP33869.1 hypothetical protein CGZ80_16875 [Rhodopirellula sp. MGV]PNY37289.1 DUF1015 domain-containing protein [Rhodopirellula baltica]